LNGYFVPWFVIIITGVVTLFDRFVVEVVHSIAVDWKRFHLRGAPKVARWVNAQLAAIVVDQALVVIVVWTRRSFKASTSNWCVAYSTLKFGRVYPNNHNVFVQLEL
jgi:hypothetical protein